MKNFEMNHESVLSSRLGLFSAKLIPQQQNAMGSLRNIDFGAFWASRVGSGKELGSGNRFRVTSFAVPRFRFSSKVSAFDEFRWVRFCSRGLDGTGSGNRVLGTRGMKKVPGSGDSVAKVPKVALHFENIHLYFATMLASGCNENQYSKGKEKAAINVHFINANLLAFGDTTYAYF